MPPARLRRRSPTRRRTPRPASSSRGPASTRSATSTRPPRSPARPRPTGKARVSSSPAPASRGRREARARLSSLLARAGQADPGQPELFPLQGSWLLEAKRTSEAAVAFEKATIVDPTMRAAGSPWAASTWPRSVAPPPSTTSRRPWTSPPTTRKPATSSRWRCNRRAALRRRKRRARRAKALGHPGGRFAPSVSRGPGPLIVPATLGVYFEALSFRAFLRSSLNRGFTA